MVNKRITDLTELTTPVSGDFIEIVDTSDTTEDPTGTNKKLDVLNFPAGNPFDQSLNTTDSPTFAGQTLTSTQIMSDNNITQIKTATFNGVLDNGNSGVSKTIDLSLAQKQKITINSNTTLTFSNGIPGSNHILEVFIDITGGYTITWANLKSGLTVPDILTTSNGITEIAVYVDSANDYIITSLKIE